MPIIGLGLSVVMTPGAAFQKEADVPLPVNVIPPTIMAPHEPALIGDVLECGTGTWGNTVDDYLYAWERNVGGAFLEIDGATSNEYTVASEDIGCDLRCTVVAINEYGSVGCVAEPVTVHPSGGIPVSTVAPSIVGPNARPYVGDTLEGNAGDWVPEATDYTVQWWRRPEAGGWSEIVGASSWNYLVSQEDAGCELQILVTGANSAGSSAEVGSSATSMVFGAPVNDGSMGVIAPSISSPHAHPHLGDLLVCNPGTWKYQEGEAFSYQWHRYEDEGAYLGPIEGAVSESYVVAFEDLALVLRCSVIASNTAGDGELYEASAGGEVWQAPICTGLPSLTTNGSGVVGDSVECSPGPWEGFPPVEFLFRWYFNGSEEALSGQNDYAIDTGIFGSGIYQCRVRGFNGAGFEEVISDTIYIGDGVI